MAAGCSFEFDRLNEICDALHDYAAQTLTDEDLIPTVRADIELEPNELTMPIAESLSLLEPFGALQKGECSGIAA